MGRHILDKNLVEAMGALEGPHWVERTEREFETLDTHCSVYGAFKAWERAQEQFLKLIDAEIMETDFDVEDFLNQGVGETIYGEGGWHRYFVLGSGEVCFSSHHSLSNYRDKAIFLGFTIR